MLLSVMGILVAGLFTSSRRAMKARARLKLQNDVVRTQSDEIHAKNLELQRQNMRLAETIISEEEKDLLMREIHHRVKNNLQVVESLLSIQQHAQVDPIIALSFREAQGRIRAMAKVHDYMYRTGGGIGDLQAYFTRLGHNVLAAYGMHDRISITVQCSVDGLREETLLPLSLIVNELLTNAVKHAFDGRDSGHIAIVLRGAGVGHELIFSDNGTGIDGGLEPRNNSFGIDLVSTLAQQLDGELRVLKGRGSTVSLLFAVWPKALRKAS